MEAVCKFCGQPSGIRINFENEEDEREYHENYECFICKTTQ